MRIIRPKLLIYGFIFITLYGLSSLINFLHYNELHDAKSHLEIEMIKRFHNFINGTYANKASISSSTAGRKYRRPPLTNLIRDREIVADVSWLLDVAIIGIPKSGTTTLVQYLSTNELKFIQKEQCDMMQNLTYITVKRLYERIQRKNIKKGIKCPGHLDSVNARREYAKHFHKTNFIVGVRHPVEWFESYYNYRVETGVGKNKRRKEYPHPNELIRRCWLTVCTKRSRFHYYLSMLGKTRVADDEKELIRPDGEFEIIPTSAKVFLYDIEQLGDKNETRASIFRDDLRQYLGLENPLPSMIYVKPQQKSNAKLKKHFENPKKVRAYRKTKKIDICEEDYNEVRGVLMENAINASRWIREYFLKSDDVVVSSKYFFEESLRRWEKDPCDIVREADGTR